jgi:hypothetical protein
MHMLALTSPRLRHTTASAGNKALDPNLPSGLNRRERHQLHRPSYLPTILVRLAETRSYVK